MRANGEIAKKGGDRKSKSTAPTLILPDLGISRDESSNWTKLAAADIFDAVVTEIEESGDELTEAAVLRAIMTGDRGGRLDAPTHERRAI
jgi:hypothetical protein